jgi:hypothetical protein
MIMVQFRQANGITEQVIEKTPQPKNPRPKLLINWEFTLPFPGRLMGEAATSA